MNNLEVVNDFEFEQSIFDGIFEGIKIKNIGANAFVYSIFSGSFNLPVCTYISGYAFYYSNFSGSLSLPLCTYIGDSAFVESNFSGSLNLPACTSVGYAAFNNSNFTQITIAANCIFYLDSFGAHSQEFLDDYNANGQLGGTYVWDGSHWIYQ